MSLACLRLRTSESCPWNRLYTITVSRSQAMVSGLQGRHTLRETGRSQEKVRGCEQTCDITLGNGNFLNMPSSFLQGYFGTMMCERLSIPTTDRDMLCCMRCPRGAGYAGKTAPELGLVGGSVNGDGRLALHYIHTSFCIFRRSFEDVYVFHTPRRPCEETPNLDEIPTLGLTFSLFLWVLRQVGKLDSRSPMTPIRS